MFPKGMRSRANSLLSSGQMIGEGIASLYIIMLVKFGWKAVFLNIGSVGMLIALGIFALIKEPARLKLS
jgi:sugar phosphate permease